MTADKLRLITTLYVRDHMVDTCKDTAYHISLSSPADSSHFWYIPKWRLYNPLIPDSALPPSNTTQLRKPTNTRQARFVQPLHNDNCTNSSIPIMPSAAAHTMQTQVPGLRTEGSAFNAIYCLCEGTVGMCTLVVIGVGSSSVYFLRVPMKY